MTRHSAYAESGVDIASGNRTTQLMAAAVRSTYGSEVLAGIGAFGGLFDASRLKAMEQPVLVASTDGVGTKTKIAAALNRWDTIGQDLVNHCINDILVQGARPLFFLDYVASSRLNPEQIASIVGGVAVACREANCALLGGETAEMPGVYVEGEVDLAGTIVGVVERNHILDGSQIQMGDVLVALPSTGLHTNGYSLARKVLANLSWESAESSLGCSIGESLLAVHQSYLPSIEQLWDAGIPLKGMAHITGGGVIDNLPRILPEGMGAVIERGTWMEPPIFRLIEKVGSISIAEMFHVFNMGLGMLLVISAKEMNQVLAILREAKIVGEIVSGAGVIVQEGQGR